MWCGQWGVLWVMEGARGVVWVMGGAVGVAWVLWVWRGCCGCAVGAVSAVGNGGCCGWGEVLWVGGVAVSDGCVL